MRRPVRCGAIRQPRRTPYCLSLLFVSICELLWTSEGEEEVGREVEQEVDGHGEQAEGEVEMVSPG